MFPFPNNKLVSLISLVLVKWSHSSFLSNHLFNLCIPVLPVNTAAFLNGVSFTNLSKIISELTYSYNFPQFIDIKNKLKQHGSIFNMLKTIMTTVWGLNHDWKQQLSTMIKRIVSPELFCFRNLTCLANRKLHLLRHNDLKQGRGKVDDLVGLKNKEKTYWWYIRHELTLSEELICSIPRYRSECFEF